MNRFFVEQMAMYSAYHRDLRNRATHFIGIPAIVFSIYIPLAWVPLGRLGAIDVNLSLALLAAVAVFYIWLDRLIGAAMVAFLLVLYWLAMQVAGLGHAVGWSVFAAAFVGGWVFQLVGHVFEGRRPALADNLLQALIGPMFLVAETIFALGLKRDLHAAVEARWKAYSVGARLAAEA